MIFFYALILLFFMCITVAMLIFMLSEGWAALTTDAPFVPVPFVAEDEIIKNLKLESGNVLYDLGCGDARILLKAVKEYPEIKAVGVEMALFPYFLAKLNTRKYKNIEIRRENIFTTDISDATHFFLYLFPGVPDKLLSRIKEKCQNNTRIVSCEFNSLIYKPAEVISIPDTGQKRGKKLFIYTF